MRLRQVRLLLRRLLFEPLLMLLRRLLFELLLMLLIRLPRRSAPPTRRLRLQRAGLRSLRLRQVRLLLRRLLFELLLMLLPRLPTRRASPRLLLSGLQTLLFKLLLLPPRGRACSKNLGDCGLLLRELRWECCRTVGAMRRARRLECCQMGLHCLHRFESIAQVGGGVFQRCCDTEGHDTCLLEEVQTRAPRDALVAGFPPRATAEHIA